MGDEGEALAAWERRLRAVEDELFAREQEALADDPTPGELAALAAERDRIALGRDRIADRYDQHAETRDRSALRRDLSASGRDQRARARDQDQDEAWADRVVAGEHRDLAAGDRADSSEERARAHASREHAAADRQRAAVDRGRAAQVADDQEDEVRGLRAALRSRHVIGQAQGLLMARHHVSSAAAFAVLVRLSQTSNTKLRDLAEELVQAAEPPQPPGTAADERSLPADLERS